jgi:hypothetical protein
MIVGTDCDVASFVVCVCRPVGAKQTQQPATDQEKEKLNPCEKNEHQSMNAVTDINFQAPKVS